MVDATLGRRENEQEVHRSAILAILLIQISRWLQIENKNSVPSTREGNSPIRPHNTGTKSKKNTIPPCSSKALQRPGGGAESRRWSKSRHCKNQPEAAAQNLIGAEVDSSSAESKQRRHQAAAPSQGAAETRRCPRIPAAQSLSCVVSGAFESSWDSRNYGGAPIPGDGTKSQRY